MESERGIDVGDRWCARCVVVMGVLTLVFAILLQRLPPPCPPPPIPSVAAAPVPGNTMLSLELAFTSREVMGTLGLLDVADSQEQEAAVLRRKSLDHANRIDYGFMVVYSLYSAALALFVGQLLRPSMLGQVLAVLGSVLAAVMLFGDFFENEQLFAMTASGALADVPNEAMSALQIWTRVKWLALAGSSLLLSVGYVMAIVRSGRWGVAIIPLLFVVAGLAIALGSIIPDYREAVGVGAQALAAAWLAGLVHGAHTALKPARA